jgi:hypothetical protein
MSLADPGSPDQPKILAVSESSRRASVVRARGGILELGLFAL